MPTFVFAYRAPSGYTRTPETAAAWWAWFESMGDQLVDPGKPVVSRAGLGNLDAGAPSWAATRSSALPT